VPTSLERFCHISFTFFGHTKEYQLRQSCGLLKIILYVRVPFCEKDGDILSLPLEANAPPPKNDCKFMVFSIPNFIVGSGVTSEVVRLG